MPDDRARKMQLLARLEQAREQRARTALREADAAWGLAIARAEATAAETRRRCQDRHDRLRHGYDSLLGSCDAHAIHALRASELELAAREAAARGEQQAAAAAADAALAACRQARDALQAVSLRRERRTRLADTLRREQATAAQNAEEDATADELMDRIGAAS